LCEVGWVARVSAFLLVLTLASSAAAAPAVRFLISGNAGMGTKEEAEPFVQRFAGFVAGKLKWSADHYEVRYATTMAETRKELETWKPGFAALSLDLWLQLKKVAPMTPLLQAQVNGKATTRYRLVVKKADGVTLESLKGSVLNVVGMEDPQFLQRVVFRNRISLPADMKIQATPRPLRALRAIAQGKGGAILLDDAQFDSLKELPFFTDLLVVYESPELPLLGLACVPANVPDGSHQAFADAMVSMCKEPEGKGICEMANIESFVPASMALLDEVAGWYDGK
jgi:hypothetical protein